MFGAISSSNTTLLHHTLYLPFREEAQVRPGSPKNPYLPSKEETQANINIMFCCGNLESVWQLMASFIFFIFKDSPGIRIITKKYFVP